MTQNYFTINLHSKMKCASHESDLFSINGLFIELCDNADKTYLFVECMIRVIVLWLLYLACDKYSNNHNVLFIRMIIGVLLIFGVLSLFIVITKQPKNINNISKKN